MELIVTVAGRQEKVILREVDGQVEVTVGDRAYRVDVVPTASGLRSLLLDGRQYEIAAQRERDGRIRLSAPGLAELAEVADPLTHLAQQTGRGAGGRRREQVSAYMPGKVVAVLAAEGDVVVAGQGIVVLEAMKMQNEIQAPHDGTLRKLFVAPGQPVEGGDPLFEVE